MDLCVITADKTDHHRGCETSVRKIEDASEVISEWVNSVGVSCDHELNFRTSTFYFVKPHCQALCYSCLYVLLVEKNTMASLSQSLFNYCHV